METNLKEFNEINDSAAFLFNYENQPDPRESKERILMSRLLTQIVFPIDSQIIDLGDLSSLLSIKIDKPPIAEGGAATSIYLSPQNQHNDILIDEPLPRLPHKVQFVRGSLKIGEKGKPNLWGDIEISFFDD